MKIAILGTRGIPASYSGFETAVEQLASRLTARGHEVIVYCRSHVVDPTLDDYKGAQLVHLRTVQNNVITMAGTQAELNVVARRGPPSLVLQLLVLTGCLSAATVGMLAVGVHRPYLIVGWAFVIAMGLTVVIAIYNPFAGSVSITFDPLLDAASRIR